MVFSNPGLLWLLFGLYLTWLLAWGWRAWRGGRGHATLRFSTLKQLRKLRPSNTLRLRYLVQGARLLTIALIMIAMARPQTGRRLTEVNTQGIDIVLVMDTSGSMQALDLDADRPIRRRRNRLQVATEVVDAFLERRDNDQVGLVVFGEEAFTQCPLTLDHGILATFLTRLEVGMAGDATAIGSAIGTAVKRLRDSEAKSKIIILLTDGRSNAGALGPIKAAEIAKTFDIKIYTIGAGTRGKAPFLVENSLFGPQVIHQDVMIDEDTLREVAAITGGAYFRAEDKGALNQIYEEIDQLEKTEITMESYMEYNEQFRWFVFPALGLLLGEVLLLGTRLRKLP